MTFSIDASANTNATLPGLIERAAAALATATTAAEVLDAKDKAGFAYTTAKAAARLAEAKNAHDAIVAACHKAMGDALIIQAAAQCRLADEYDAAQERGEAQKPGGDRRSINIPKENNDLTVKDIGLTSKQVYEARAIRDAEKMRPGIVRETVEGRLKAGRGPTLADVKHAIAPAPAPAQPHEAAPSPATKAAAATPVQPDAKTVRSVYTTPDSDDWDKIVPSKRLDELGEKYNELADKHDDLVERLEAWASVLEDAGLEVEEDGAYVMAIDREKFDEWVIGEVVQFAEIDGNARDKKTGDYYELIASLEKRSSTLMEEIRACGLMPIKRQSGDGPELKLVVTEPDTAVEWFKDALVGHNEGRLLDFMDTPSRKIADCIVESMSSSQLKTLQTAIAEQIDKRNLRRKPLEASREEIMPHYREADPSESETPPVAAPKEETPSAGALS